MKAGFRQSMSWLHTWGGLVTGWLLFVVFLAGTLAVFDREISHWMRPELHALQPAAPAAALALAQKVLHERAPRAESWAVLLPSAPEPALRLNWRADGKPGRAWLDAASGSGLAPRETRGGGFFVGLHFQLLLGRTGLWIVGFAAMSMLVALVTGIIVHRKIFRDFFTFRPGKSAQRAWLDAHNVSSVMVLPFTLMITYTGLVISWAVYMPAGLLVAYDGDRKAFAAERLPAIERKASGVPAGMLTLAQMEQRARPWWGADETVRLRIQSPGDANAIATIFRGTDRSLVLIGDAITIDAASGEVLQVRNSHPPASLAQSAMSGLHFARFGGYSLRWLYFLAGIAASAAIATGLVLWTAKRRGQQARTRADAAGWRLVECLNVAGVAGLLVACMAFFYANRVIPADLPDRALLEMRTMFAAWGLMLLHAALRRQPGRAWIEQLGIAAALALGLPLLNAATGGLPLTQSIAHGHWIVAGFDLAALACGSLLAVAAWGIGRPGNPVARRRPAAASATSEAA